MDVLPGTVVLTPTNMAANVYGYKAKNLHSYNPLILFSEWDENGKEYSSDSYVLANNNIQIFNDSTHTHILMSGENFLRDMLEYEQMNVCYIRADAPDYKTVENDIYKQYVTAIPVDLYQFQKQYRNANKWMEDYPISRGH